MTLVILWAYMSFAQLIVIWMGNERVEASWYIRRGTGHWNSWRLIAMALCVLHFFVPFVLLLLRYAKRHFNILTALAAGLLVMRVVDLYWLSAPSEMQEHDGFFISWLTPFPLLAIGGIWLAAFIWLLRRRPLVCRLEGEPEPILPSGHAAPGIG